MAALAPLIASCGIACGCAAPPDPSWTPEPTSTEVAALVATKVAAGPSMTATGIAGPAGRPMYQASALDTLALVDIQSGDVLEVVLENQMPDTADLATTAAAAHDAAERFMTRTGMSTHGLTAKVEFAQSGGVAAYKVTWRDPEAGASPMFQVLVAGSTGAVFAYLDLRMRIKLIAPMISRTRAVQLAMASDGSDDSAVSADLRVSFNAAGAQVSVWRVAADMDVDVDAVTGEITRASR